MTSAEQLVKPGRKRDHTRDQEILDAALAVLAETGYECMTVDMVAARAKAGKATVYRRWPSKAELVIDAIACMKRKGVELDDLPDTGTLRGDLVAMMKPPTVEDSEKKVQVMAGVASMLSRDPGMADALRKAMIEPRAEVNRVFFRRAIARGEIPADVNIELLATIGTSMVMYRTMLLRKPVDSEFLLSIIDDLVLPACGLGRGVAD
jgi:AcrR family transcriptional regulator